MWIYRKIRAGLFLFTFFASIAVVVLFFSLTKSQAAMWRIRRIWAWSQRLFIPYRPLLVGAFDPEARLLIANHQSTLDIIALEELSPRNLCWIAKKELTSIPFFRIAMIKPKFICIDRNNPRELVRIIKEAKDRLAEGRLLIIFPEGTRSQGEELLAFQNGAAVLSQKLNLRVQPVLLIDSAKIVDTKSFFVKAGQLKIICMDAVDTSEEDWLEKTRQKMQKRLDEERAAGLAAAGLGAAGPSRSNG